MPVASAELPLASALSALPSQQDSIDTAPPPPLSPPVVAAPAKPQPAPVMREPERPREPERARPLPEPQRAEPAREPERIRVPDVQRSPRPGQQMMAPEPRSAPGPMPARPSAPGSTPLEMALEGEVARAAAAHALEIEGRVIADPAPPIPSKPIAQATTKHPPASGNTFGDLLRRSLALRPR
jgi:hypothetical protein